MNVFIGIVIIGFVLLSLYLLLFKFSKEDFITKYETGGGGSYTDNIIYLLKLFPWWFIKVVFTIMAIIIIIGVSMAVG